MRHFRALPPALVAAGALLLTACDPVASPPAGNAASPAPESTAVSPPTPSRAPAEVPSATATGIPDVVRATAGGVLTVDPKPAPLVSAWISHQLYELSFVVPASPDKLSFSDDPDAYSVYDWNEGDTFDPEPRVHMSVASSATDGRASAPVAGILGTGSVSTLELPGSDDAWLEVAPAPPDPRMAGSYRAYSVSINTAERKYLVHIEVPSTGEGAEVAQEAIAALHLTTG
jgi:hypothetical protein